LFSKSTPKLMVGLGYIPMLEVQPCAGGTSLRLLVVLTLLALTQCMTIVPQPGSTLATVLLSMGRIN